MRVGDAVGPFRVPLSGIPAGCPLAVAALGVVTWPWQLAVVACGATTARRYVDDLTAWHRGEHLGSHIAAAAMWSATELFVSAAQLTISRDKSGVFASTGPGRAALREADLAAPVLLSCKDLGVQQHAGAHGARASAARVQATFGRFERLSGLPLPYAKRSQAVASPRLRTAPWSAPRRRASLVGYAPGLAGLFGAAGGLGPSSSACC